jgi:hypothetical protein
VSSSVQSGNGGRFIAEPGTSEVLRYDGVTGAFLGTFIAPDSGGLRFPTFMSFTETDPTTLNYDGAPSPSAPATAMAAPTAVTGWVQLALGALDQGWWDPSAQAGNSGPAPTASYQMLDLILADLGGHPRRPR